MVVEVELHLAEVLALHALSLLVVVLAEVARDLAEVLLHQDLLQVEALVVEVHVLFHRVLLEVAA